MNYIQQLNAFYRLLPSKLVSPAAQCLYCYLMHRNNELGWITEFTVTNTVICGYTGLSRLQLTRARMELINAEYITYKKGKGNHCGTYLIVRFDTQSDTQTDTQTDTQSDTQSDTQLIHKVNTLNKLNKTKQNKKETVVVCLCAYEDNIGILNESIAEQIASYLDDGMEQDLIIAAINEAVEQGKPNFAYIKGILNSCLNQGITTLDGYLRKNDEFRRKKAEKSAKKGGKSKFNNYEDRNKSDYEDLESQILDEMLDDN